MIYNLFLNSTSSHALTTSATNRGQRIYALDWSFLPQYKRYKITFRFVSKKGSYTGDDNYIVTANFGPLFSSFTGGKNVEQKSNLNLGFLSCRQGTTLNTDLQIYALPSDNPAVSMNDRPSNNYIEILLLAMDGTQYNLTVDYLMIVSFTEDS